MKNRVMGKPAHGLLCVWLTAVSMILGCAGIADAAGDGNAAEQEQAESDIGPASVSPPSNVVWVARFNSSELRRWEETSFKGHTQYQVQEVDGRGVLLAHSRGAASAIGKRVKIDLTATPYLNWTWKINRRLEGIAETTRAGDDFAARIYLVKKAGILGRNSKAVNYVWSSNQSAGNSWSNAYQPGNSKMIAVRGADAPTKQWVSEKRNVAEDFKRLFGTRINSVDVVAIMTDSDNSGLTAEASYAEIFFSAE